MTEADAFVGPKRTWRPLGLSELDHQDLTAMIAASANYNPLILDTEVDGSSFKAFEVLLRCGRGQGNE
jgi:hypothetical protein